MKGKIFFACAVACIWGGELLLLTVGGQEAGVVAQIPAALGPAPGSVASGAVQTPALAVEAPYQTYLRNNRKGWRSPYEIPSGYPVDPITLRDLKAKPPVPSSPGPRWVDDSGTIIRSSSTFSLLAAQELYTSLSAPLQSFPGITDTGVIPADTGIAAGPNHVVETVNSAWQAFAKTGTPTTALIPFCGSGGWWAPVLPDGNIACFDPKVLYDQFRDRWVMVAIALKEDTQQSWYLIAASHTSDPTDRWCVWALDATVNGSVPSTPTPWADFPQLGLDDQAIYIASNQFSFSTDTFLYSRVRIISTEQLYANTCGRLDWWDFWDLRNADGSSAFTVQPAYTFGSPGVEYLINSYALSGASITLWFLANPSDIPTLTRADVPVGSYSLPPNAAQCEGGVPIDTSDARLLGAIYRDGSLWTVHTIASGDGFSRIRYLEIDPSGPTVLQDFAFGLSGFFYYYPAVMMDDQKNLITVFNRSSATECVSLRYTGRLVIDPPNTLRESALLQAGVALYVRVDALSRNRWGDYSGISLDPADPSRVWIAGEYVPALNTWATWIGEVSFQSSSPTFADTVGLYDETTSVFQLRYSNTAGPPDLIVPYGPPGAGWVPVVGDWDGDGEDTVGLYDPANSVFFLRDSNDAGPADLIVPYGPPGAGWMPVVGDWDGDGTDTVGLYDPANSVFFLRDSNTSGPADLAFVYGLAGASWAPLAGSWQGGGTLASVGEQKAKTEGKGMKSALALGDVQSLPNPAREQVIFRVQGQGVLALRVKIYDLAGRLIFKSAWSIGNQLGWDLLDEQSQPVANGVYLYVVTVQGYSGQIEQSNVHKLVVLR